MESLRDFDQNRYAALSTFRKTGVAVTTPVWFAAAGDKLYVTSAGDAGKVKRLRNSSRARLASCDMRGGHQGEAFDTTARIVTDPEVARRAKGALTAKYGWQVRVLDFFSWIGGRLGRRAYVEIEYPA